MKPRKQYAINIPYIDFCEYLHNNGYLDSDWIFEEPNAIIRFLKTNKPQPHEQRRNN